MYDQKTFPFKQITCLFKLFNLSTRFPLGAATTEKKKNENENHAHKINNCFFITNMYLNSCSDSTHRNSTGFTYKR